MSKIFQGRQDLIRSAQRQVKTLIDRKDAKNMQTLQDWHMSMVKNHVAE